jgi:arsenate reductase
MISNPQSDPGPRAPDPVPRKRVLVLCTGNSCRSQMAEGWINHLLGDRWEACSAGTAPAAHVNPHAVRVMAEVGVDISRHRPQLAAGLAGEAWDLVVTVCDHAREVCPFFPHPGEQIHLGFPDPVAAVGTEEEVVGAYRRVRDAIRERLVPEVARRG